MNSARYSHYSKAFTLVELLIVIVIIAILAAITVVVYNGIQNRAYDSATMAELHNLAQQLTMSNVEQTQFSTTNPLKVSPGAYQLNNRNNGAFCTVGSDYAVVILSKSGNVFYSYDGQGAKQINFTWTDSVDSTCAAVFIDTSNLQDGWMWWGGSWSNWVRS